MKKFVFGCVLMLFGIVGGTGWLIASVSLVEPGAWSSVFNLFPIIGFGGIDGCVVLLFYIFAMVGAVIAVREMKE